MKNRINGDQNGRVLVTGGSGFIGQHLVRALLAAGRKIRCLAFKGEEWPKDLSGSEIFPADLLDPVSLKGIGQDIDTVFHLAAFVDPPVRLIYKRADLKNKYFDVNCKGTSNLLDNCGQVKRFIYLSSTAVIGQGSPQTEESLCRPASDYGFSKLEAEERLLRFAKQKKISAVILRPASVYGPGDFSWLPVFRSVLRQNVLFPGAGKNLWQSLFVGDLVDVMLKAENRGGDGSIYLLAEDSCSLRVFLAEAAAAAGVKVRIISFPPAMAFCAAGIKQFLENIFKVRIFPFGVDLSVDLVKRLTRDRACSCERAKQELGFKCSDRRQNLRLLYEWYKDNKLV